MNDEKASIIVNVQYITGTGLIYRDIKRLLRMVGQTLWLASSTILLCYSEWLELRHIMWNTKSVSIKSLLHYISCSITFLLIYFVAWVIIDIVLGYLFEEYISIFWRGLMGMTIALFFMKQCTISSPYKS